MRHVEATQLVIGQTGATSIRFQSLIQVNHGDVTVVMLDPLGRRGMEIHWRVDGVTYDVAPWMPDQVRPLNVLADIVMAHWPVRDIQAGFSGTNARLEHDARSRIISHAGRDVMRIEYDPLFVEPWIGSLTIQNLALGYTLRIQTTVLES